MLRPNTTNEKLPPLKPSVTSGRRSTRKSARSSSSVKRSSQMSTLPWIPCKGRATVFRYPRYFLPSILHFSRASPASFHNLPIIKFDLVRGGIACVCEGVGRHVVWLNGKCLLISCFLVLSTSYRWICQ